MNPLYLIIDTNIWIYMANGELKDSAGKRTHIKVFNMLKELVDNNEVAVIISPIVIEEFDRNREWLKKYIKCLDGRLTERRNYLKNHKEELTDTEIKEIESKISALTEERDINMQHIQEVEDFLKSKTTAIPLPDSVKIKCFDQALAKKAPFAGKKSNSMADLAILLSSVEYVDTSLSMKLWDDFIIRPRSIFISGNVTDFSQDKEAHRDSIHPDLSPIISSVNMEYSISLGTTLNSISMNKLSIEEIDEMDEYLPYDYIDCPNCAGWDDRMGMLDSHSLANLIDENAPIPIPKEQLIIPFEFSEEDEDWIKKRQQRESSIELHQCNWCNSQFFSCPVCGSLVMYDEETQCDNCETKFECEDNYDRKGFLISQTVKILKFE